MTMTRQIARELNHRHTEVLVETYADRTLVLVSQLGKVGNLIQASIPPTIPLTPAPAFDSTQHKFRPLPPPPPAIQLTPLLGNAPSAHMQTLHSLYAAQIATIVWTELSDGSLEVFRRSVIVGIALQKEDRAQEEAGLTENEREVFQGVMAMLQDLFNQS
ncbi:hypothetical protein BD779DRAFT_1610099 [Infundibulicybe gibba]|nr:hypothetical protein BD779DRAFT_1610099 [Infundibulicybe gibba]